MGVFITGLHAREIEAGRVGPGFSFNSLADDGDTLLSIHTSDRPVTGAAVASHVNNYLDKGRAPEAFLIEHGLPGGISDGKNFIAYNDLFAGIDRDKPTNFFIESCFGGTALRDTDSLPAGSKLFTAVNSSSVAYATQDGVSDYNQEHITGANLTAEQLYKTRLATSDYNLWASSNVTNTENGLFTTMQVPQELIANMPDTAQGLIPAEFGIAGHGVVNLRDHVGSLAGKDLRATAERLKASVVEPEHKARIDRVAGTLQAGNFPGGRVALAPEDHGAALALTYQDLQDSGQIDRWVAEARETQTNTPQVAEAPAANITAAATPAALPNFFASEAEAKAALAQVAGGNPELNALADKAFSRNASPPESPAPHGMETAAAHAAQQGKALQNAGVADATPSEPYLSAEYIPPATPLGKSPAPGVSIA